MEQPKKRGRPPKYTGESLEQLKWRINFLYHHTPLGVNRIATRFGISIAKVNELLVSKEYWDTVLAEKGQQDAT